MSESNNSAELSPAERQWLDSIRAEVRAIIGAARELPARDAQQFVAERIERFARTMADVSKPLALAVSRHMAHEVRRLMTH